eukprot:TRINITY_DN12329_c0_g1_i1.p1 TRINITY_DN12329_c0_g1~~TRINITY_DN12329_c0_g1_i1.p1  ORF type:complete len:182 (-),score=36.26 TRINITY_DN12329_c0_g1_i1:41-586(-)
MKLLHILVLACMVALIAAEPFLIFKKTIGTPARAPTVENDLLVNLQVFNVGDSNALSVVVEDKWSDQYFAETKGETSASWGVIPPGSNFSHSFILVPNTAGRFTPTRGQISYKNTYGKEFSGYSNSPQQLSIYEWSEVDKRAGAHFQEWAVFTVLIALSVAFPGLYYGFITFNYQNGILKK